MSHTNLKINLTWTVTELLAGHKVSPLLIDRVNQMLEITAPYYNDDHVDRGIVEDAINNFKDHPDLAFHGLTIQDGMIYPILQDDVTYNDFMIGMKELMPALDVEHAATIAFITKHTSAAYYSAA